MVGRRVKRPVIARVVVVIQNHIVVEIHSEAVLVMWVRCECVARNAQTIDERINVFNGIIHPKTGTQCGTDVEGF